MIGFGLIAVILIVMVSSNMPPEGGIVNPAVFILGGPAVLIACLYGLSWYLHK
jgi:hypothetical protein